jgi:hypothetical protein
MLKRCRDLEGRRRRRCKPKGVRGKDQRPAHRQTLADKPSARPKPARSLKVQEPARAACACKPMTSSVLSSIGSLPVVAPRSSLS